MKNSMRSLSLLPIVTVALISGCDRSATAPAASDGGFIAYAKGGNGGGNGGGGSTSVPITIEATGGFEVAAQSAFVKTETADLLEFGSQGLVVTRTTHFDLTASMARTNGFNECRSKVGQNGGDLPLAEKERLIGWLEGVTRSGDFNGSIDLTMLGSASSSQLGTRTTDAEPNQHVGLGTFGLIEGAEGPTVTRIGTDTYRFTGGIVQMWDRNLPVPQQATLQCRNYDEVIVKITR